MTIPLTGDARPVLVFVAVAAICLIIALVGGRK